LITRQETAPNPPPQEPRFGSAPFSPIQLAGSEKRGRSRQSYRTNATPPRRSARDAGTTYVIQVSASLKDGTESAILTGRFNVFIADSDKWADAQLEKDTLKLAEPELAPVAAPQRLRAISTFPAEALRGWADPVGTDVDTSTKFPSRIRRLKDKAEMVLIPAGTFQMGAVPGDELAEESERPRHKVTLTNAYYMDVNEVTVDQWKLFVSAVKKRALEVWQAKTPGDEPIFNVDHRAATAYGAWASAELPTEAQWERAAKGGQDDNVYPWGKVDIADRRSGEMYSMVKVRSYVPNAYGLYDMAGNAKEWCADYYDASYYARSPDTDPTGAASGEERVVRSGWNVSVQGWRPVRRPTVTRSRVAIVAATR